MVETDTPEVVLSVIVLTGISNRFSARCWRRDLWHPIGLADEDQTISIVPQAIQSRGAEEFVSREGLVPFLEGQIASDDGGLAFVSFCNEIMEIFIGRRAQRLQPEIVNDQKWHAGERREASIVSSVRAGGVEDGGELGGGVEQHIDAAAHGELAERLGEMAFAGAAGAGVEHWCKISQLRTW